MRKIFALFLFLSPGLAHAAFVTGQIRNATPGTQVEIFVPHRYLDGYDGHYRGILDGQSQFAIEAAVPEPQLVFLLFNDDRLPIFLAPHDTLALRADAFQFPLAVNFLGKKNGANNRLLQEYLRQNPLDFNEFNNIRFKIGQYWTSVEMKMNDQMENLLPSGFKPYMDTLRAASIALFEKSGKQNPDAITPDFAQWLHTEITYLWAYHLLVYGQVYAGRHSIQPDFFDFLYEAPIIGESIGSDSYRQFLLAFMARQQTKSGNEAENFWAGEYQLAGKLLSGKPLAFFRSEVISTAFSAEKYRELLPLYTHFLQTNEYPAYDGKVEGLYQKYARVLPGSSAPTFEAADAEGNLIGLEQLRGKVVYLNFWASWCGACLRKMEFMDEYEAELAANGIEILNVSVDENADNWRAALTERAFKGRNLLASAGYGRNIAAIFGVEAVPQYFIIGRDGTFADKAAATQPADIRQQLLRASGKW
ncbi:MAG: TlpA family protein disulfide reductase [Saprospiraceae bacterium]